MTYSSIVTHILIQSHCKIKVKKSQYYFRRFISFIEQKKRLRFYEKRKKYFKRRFRVQCYFR